MWAMRAGVVVAVATFVVALAAVPSSAHEGPHLEQQRLTAEIEAAGPNVDGHRLLERAMAERDEGELAEAEEDLEAAEHANPPGDPGLIAIERARIAFDRQLDEQALDAYGEVLRIERPEGRETPTRLFAIALAERAVTQERLERWPAARDDWDAAFAARPTAEAALARGLLDELLGEAERAERGYREAMKATPTIVIARALCRVLLDRGDAAEVVALADDAIDATPFDVEWLLVRADALDVAGSTAEAHDDRLAALAEIDRAMRVRPSDLRRLVRARVWLALGRAESAAREAEDIARRRPELTEAAELAHEARAAERSER